MNIDNEDDGGTELDDGLKGCLLSAHVADQAVAEQQCKTLVMAIVSNNVVIFMEVEVADTENTLEITCRHSF